MVTLNSVPFHRISNPAKLQRLMQALLMIEADLQLPVLLTHLAEAARELVDARYGAIGVLNEQATAFEEFITVGWTEAEDAAGARPTGQRLLGPLTVEPQPLAPADLTGPPDSYGVPADHPPVTSFLDVVVQMRGSVYGNFYLTDKQGGAEFTDEDKAVVAALALAAGIAIESARLHDRVRNVTLLEDRDRIARDLHDTVIQRLFALGLSLQITARMTAEAGIVERIGGAVDELDGVIRQLRSAIFDLETSPGDDGVRRAVLNLAHEMRPVVGSTVRVTFEGAVDAVVGPRISVHLLASLREALTNVGKHARASTVAVLVAVGDDVCLEVIDDGVGFSDHGGDGHGLRNLRNRAERLDGGLEVTVPEGGGTRLVWRVPT